MSKNTRTHTRTTSLTWRRALPIVGALLGVLVALGGLWLALGANDDATPAKTTVAHPVGPSRYAPQPEQQVSLPSGRTYFVEQMATGDELMFTRDGSVEVPVATIPNGFGSQSTDMVSALQLSPGLRYLAIDGMTDHGDTVWIAATTTGTIRQVPANALGSFLHWLPDGQHFLFRPYLPQGPVDGTWNPGLWIVDAATGSSVNLPLPEGMTAMNLIDAAPDPSGTHLVLSLTQGLGSGSTVWSVTPDGMSSSELFQSDSDVAMFAWSPDGSQLAYETITDAVIPFRPAGLWVMGRDEQRTLVSQTDGGHGFAPVWSPDGSQLAFVARLNATDADADSLAGALVSAVAVLTTASNTVTTVAGPTQTGQPRNLEPSWSAEGTLVFTAMAASEAESGAALSAGTLWSAQATGDATSFSTTPLGTGTLALGADLVAVVH